MHSCTGYLGCRLYVPCRLHWGVPETWANLRAQPGMRSTTHTVPSSRFCCQGGRTIRPTMFCNIFAFSKKANHSLQMYSFRTELGHKIIQIPNQIRRNRYFHGEQIGRVGATFFRGGQFVPGNRCTRRSAARSHKVKMAAQLLG